MKNSKYLPSKTDWNKLLRWSEKADVLLNKKSRFDTIPIHEHRFLIAISRQILDIHPTLREEIIEESDHMLQDISTIDDDLHSLSSEKLEESRRRIITGQLKDMVSKGYISAHKLKDWGNKHNLFIDGVHKSSFLYNITYKGILAYELGLTLPYIGLSLLGYRTYSYNDFFVNYGILSGKNRFMWNEDYIQKYKFKIQPFNEVVIEQLNKFLGNDLELFWNMTSPQILLLREYATIRQAIKGLNISLEEIEEEEDFEGEENPVLEYNTSIYDQIQKSSNIERSMQIKIEYCKNIIDSLIKKEWLKLGFKISDLDKHCPKDEPNLYLEIE